MLDLRKVTVRFGTAKALEDITLHVRQGEALTVRGVSGSGKTTLLRVIAGLTAPSMGEIWLQSAQVSRPDRVVHPHLRRLAMVFQEPRLWPHMTVRDNITFGLRELNPSERVERLGRVADKTGIKDFLGRYPADLSGGQARRVALARALAPRRPLILMDEPLTNLDAEARRELADVIRRSWEEEGFALLYVTHDASEELAFAGRTIRLDRGRLVTG